MVTARATFTAESASISQARRFVRRTLAEWEASHLEDDAAMVVTELATNSVIHAHGGFVLELAMADQALRMAVSDNSPRAPRVKAHRAEATTGRGLQLVAACAESWGVEQRSDGKTVWATLPASVDGATGWDTTDGVASHGTASGEPASGAPASGAGPAGGRAALRSALAHYNRRFFDAAA